MRYQAIAKRKTDKQLREEISFHSKTAREFLSQSHKVHMQALQAELTAEHIQIMRRVIELQKLAIIETKKVSRLENTLLKRQRKEINDQYAALL